MTTRIQLGNIGYLDVAEDVAIPLNFSIAEIRDISKRSGAFSKTIVLAGTNNNNQLLGQLFNVNVADSSFDLNVKQQCTIIQNDLPIFEGFFQLLNVKKLSPSLSNGDEFIEYEAQITSGSGDFFSKMGEKLLTDLPYWDQYNHTYTLSAITATSAHTVNDGYTYILPWSSQPTYVFNDFTPAIWAKQYWDRIFLEAGYTYDWASLEACSFDKLIIPYNGDFNTQNLSDFYIRAGFDSGSTYTQNLAFGSLDTDIFNENSFTFKYDDTTTAPNLDPNNTYNTTTGVWTSNFNGSLQINLGFKFRVIFNVPVNCIFRDTLASGILKANFNIIFVKNNTEFVTVPITEYILLSSNSIQDINIPAGSSIIFDGLSPNISAVFENVEIGDEIRTNIQIITESTGTWFESNGVTPLSLVNYPDIQIDYPEDYQEFSNNYYIVNPRNVLNLGQTVEVKEFIPKQIKQRDFVRSIVNMFNLYITPNKFVENNLIIQTRDEYFDSGDVLDWTDKLDINQDVIVEFLPDLQDKRLILTYKQDNDEWNKQYQLATSEVYGQVQYEFENEFVQNEKKIELIFSPTPIIPNQGNLPVPAIIGGNPKNNIRILHYDGWIDGQWSFSRPGISGSQIYSTYPYAGHLDNPINPTLDINFAQPDYATYSTYETVTNNNLYNKYWSRFIKQIETGKMLTGFFYLTEQDIATLQLNAKIWVNDAYWNINRIIDYNANANGLTKVELISIDDTTQFAPFESNRDVLPDLWDKTNWLNNFASIQDSPTRNIFGQGVTHTTVNGVGNAVQGKSNNSLILGNNNNYTGRYGIVAGEDNTVTGEYMYVFGASGQTFTGSSQAIFEVPVSAQTISVQEIFIGGSSTPIEPAVMVSGSAGTNSVRQVASLTDATGDAAFATGQDTLASGDFSSSFGFQTQASGIAAHAEGSLTTASGGGSHAEGISTIASTTGAHAEGQGTLASGTLSHAEGLQTTASGNNSHAEGNNTQAVGNNSHAEGNQTQALGDGCHSQGIGSIADGLASHAGGNESRTQIDGEFASSCTSLGAVGQTQYGTFDGFTATVNNTPTLLDFLSNGAAVNGWRPNFTASPTTAAAFRYLITCINLATGDSRLITGEGMIKWITGTPTLVFASTPSNNGDVALAAVTATPVASGNGLQFQVTGLAATSLTWRVRVDYTF